MRFPVSWLSIPLRLVFGWFRPRKPVLGAYLAGTVVSRGDRVTRFQVGDVVYGTTGFRFDGYGEYVNVSEDAVLAPKPSNLSPSQAASIPLGGLNAVHFMRHANIRAGERMLILGAGASERTKPSTTDRTRPSPRPLSMTSFSASSRRTITAVASDRSSPGPFPHRQSPLCGPSSASVYEPVRHQKSDRCVCVRFPA